MADEIKNLQNIAQIEWQDPPIMHNSQTLAQVEWQDPPIMYVTFLIAQVEWVEGTAGWTGKLNGVTNPAKINGVAVASVGKVTGVF